MLSYICLYVCMNVCIKFKFLYLSFFFNKSQGLIFVLKIVGQNVWQIAEKEMEENMVSTILAYTVS